MVSDSFPGLDGSGLELGMNGGALAFNLDEGGMGLGLVPLEFNSDTGVVGGFFGYCGDFPPPPRLYVLGVSFSGVARSEFSRQ